MTPAYPTDHGSIHPSPESNTEASNQSAGAEGASPASTDADETMSKADLLAALAAAQRQFDDAITGLDEAALVEPGVVGAWSIKDLIGHVAAWEQLVIESVEQWWTGEAIPTPAWSSADEFNAQAAGRKSDWTLEAVRVDAAQTRRHLQAVLAQLTDDEWSRPVVIRDRERPGGAWIGGALSGDDGPGTHAAEHARQIQAWRAARRRG